MKKNNRVIAFLACPNIGFLIFEYIFTIAVVVVALTLVACGFSDNIFAYVSYGLAAVSLGYSIYTVVKVLPAAKAKITQKIKSNKLTAKITSDHQFRAIIFASVSLIICVGYAILNGVVAIVSTSLWFGALAAYYLLLTIMRSSVIFARSKGDNDFDEEVRQLRVHRSCGISLIVMIAALSLVIAQMVSANDSFKYAGLMIYAGAAYTFFKVTMAIINLVKAKKRKNVMVVTIRNINIADAAVSILALQTAMFQSFSSGGNVAAANALTGLGVCLFIFGLGTHMIVSATIKLKKLKGEKNG